MRISSSLFEGLCRVTAEGKPEPGMAERWDITEDKKTYTFHLRAGTTWSDGKPMVAQDFVDSWRRVLTPETGADYANLMFIVRGARAFFEGMEKDFAKVGVQALDERTLQVELENPTPYFIDLCSFITLAPVSLSAIRQHDTAWIKPQNIVTNGAYILEDWRLDDYIRLKKNPRYWYAANVKMSTV